MKNISGSARVGLLVSAGLALSVAACVFAQQTTSNSTSHAQDGHATASSSAQATSTSTSGAQQGFTRTAIPMPGQMDNRPNYAVWYTLGSKDQRLLVEASRAHDDYVVNLMKRGMVTMEGPFADGTGSLLILRASDDNEAKTVVEGDPSVRSGALVPTLKRWNLRGSHFVNSSTNQDRGVSIGQPVRTGGG